MKKPLLRIFALLATCLSLVLASSSCAFLMSGGCAHEWSDATCSSPSECTLCGAVSGSALEHEYVHRTVEPTCTSEGYDCHICRLCGYEYKDAYTSALPHTESAWIFDPPATEYTDGVRYTECTVCGIVIKERETVLAHAHTYYASVTDPTCIDDGYTTYTCRCGDYYVDDITPALGHSTVSVTGRAATCTDLGYSDYEYCTVCDYTTYLPISATGHRFGTWQSDGNGSHIRVCDYDGSHVERELCYGGTPTDSDAGICSACGGEYFFTVRDGNSAYGYLSLSSYENAESLRGLYLELQGIAESFTLSDSDITAEDGYYIIGRADYTKYSLTADEAMAVWKIFYIDTPAYYWISNVASVRGSDLLLSIGGDYASASHRDECDTALAEMVDACGEYIDGAVTELERAVGIAAYVMSSMEYSYEPDGVTPTDELWAHNLVGLALYGEGVCETYSKAYLYLCSLYGVECIMGSGVADGVPHAWNYVSIDGIWYGADITWCDNYGDIPVFDSFGLSSALMGADHTLYPSDLSASVEFHYAIPTVSESSVELAALYEDGTYLGLYRSIDLALAAIPDGSTSSYEIRIGYYSHFVKDLVHSISTDTLPDAESIRIVGRNVSIGEGYLDYNTPIVIDVTFSIVSYLELADLELSGEGGLYLASDSAELAFSSDGAYVSVEIASASGAGTTVLIDTVDKVYFMSSLTVDVFNMKAGMVCFGASPNINILKGSYRNNILVTGSDVQVKPNKYQ